MSETVKPVMAEPLNLWTALTAIEYCHRRHDEIGPGPNVTRDDLRALGQQARFHDQELDVQAVDGGWRIRVFAVDDRTDCVVEVFLPSDWRQPARIVKDRIGSVEYHH